MTKIHGNQFNSNIELSRHEVHAKGTLRSHKAQRNWLGAGMALIKSLWHEFISMLQTPFHPRAAKYSAVKSTHEEQKMLLAWNRALFGKEQVVGEARNIASREVVKNRADFEAGVALLNQCRAQSSLRDVSVNKHATPASARTDGICTGIRMDIAQKFLVEGQDIETIIQANAKGASAEAAANQAVYALLSPPTDIPTRIQSDIFGSLRTLSHDPAAPIDFIDVGRVLLLFDPEIRAVCLNNDEIKQQFNTVTPMALAFKSFFSSPAVKKWVDSKDIAGFKEAITDAIHLHFQDNKQREQALMTLHWTISFLQYKQVLVAKERPKLKLDAGHTWFDKLKAHALKLFGSSKRVPNLADWVKDRQHRYILKSVLNDQHDLHLQNFIASQRALQAKSITDQVGLSFNKNDHDYLQNIIGLSPGFYAVSLQTETGNHAISYIKMEDGSAYILDPNQPQVRARDNAEALALFKTLLSQYSQPRVRGEMAQKAMYHRLRVFQFEKAPSV